MNNWVEYNNVAGFSPWGIGSNSPSGPTSVTLESFTAQSESFPFAPVLFFGSIGSVLVFVAWRLRRK